MKQDSTLILKIVKYSAITLSVLMVAGIVTLMVLSRGTGEDITGIVAPALLITFASSVVATVAAVLQKRVQKALAACRRTTKELPRINNLQTIECS
jgi:hypothetical protein